MMGGGWRWRGGSGWWRTLLMPLIGGLWGGFGRGRGWRWMYRLTGLPGWMRFGFSPGWLGRSPTGLGPAATFLMTGQWPTPQMQAWWNAMGGYYQPAPPTGAANLSPNLSPQEELQMLKEQAKALQEELDAVLQRIKELEGQS